MNWNSDTLKIVGTILGILIVGFVLLIGGACMVLASEMDRDLERLERLDRERRG